MKREGGQWVGGSNKEVVKFYVPRLPCSLCSDINSHSSGMAYVAALLLMHMNEEVYTYTHT